ncbi:MAG: toll/interleukin-1 receptor domain-containing protein [Anaerolineae bacterium]|nr:toll/interleukin-1 receptor domain-containing protein [Anaerolineae bacterium]
MSTSSGRHFFISYSRTDTAQKQNIIKQLRARGIHLWVDIENLVPGTPAWEREIERAIRGAAGIIVLLSPESNNSEWVRREISFAEQNDKYVFPVLIRGDEDDSIPLRLSNHQWVDLRKNYNNGLDELADALKDHLGITAVSKEIEQKERKPVKIMQEDLKKFALPGLSVLIGLVFVAGLIISGSFIRNDTAPDQLSQYLNDVQVLNIDTFDDPLGSGWDLYAGTIENGVLEIIGNEDWNFVSRNGEFGENQGVVIDFNYSTDSLSEIFLEHGTWDTDGYRRFGVYIGGDHAELNKYAGKNDQGGANLSGNLTLEPGRTYSLLIAILPDGEFLEVIWEPSNSSETLIYREQFDETWAGLTWTLWIGGNQGTIQIDNFNKIRFSSAK